MFIITTLYMISIIKGCIKFRIPPPHFWEAFQKGRKEGKKKREKGRKRAEKRSRKGAEKEEKMDEKKRYGGQKGK